MHDDRLQFFQSLFREGWKAGWEKVLSIECYARISWDLPISVRSRQTRGLRGGQKSTDTIDEEHLQEIVEFWREKEPKGLLAKDASLALQYFMKEYSFDMLSQLSLILVPACTKIVGAGAMSLPFKSQAGLRLMLHCV